MAEQRVAFIIGCPRSGTSILGELLDTSPNVYYAGESNQPFWHSLSPDDYHHEQDESHMTEDIINQVRGRFAEQYPTDKLVIDKTPPNILRLPMLYAAFPDAYYIHIVRHGLDVACSLVPGLSSDSGWSHLKPKHWEGLQICYKNTQELAANLWLYVSQKIISESMLRRIKHWHQVRFEDLIQKTEEETLALFEFLELPIGMGTVKFMDQIDNDPVDGYNAMGQDFWQTSQHPTRMERWKHDMPPDLARRLRDKLGPSLRHYGYEL